MICFQRIGLFVAFAAAGAFCTSSTGRDDGPWVANPHSWDTPPEGNKWMSMAPANHTMEMRVGVVPADRDGLEKAVYAMSTPGNPEYGKYMDFDKVRFSKLWICTLLISVLGQSVHGPK